MLRARTASLPPLNLSATWPYWLIATVLLAMGLNHVTEALADWHLHDMFVYRDAALRIESGQLYGGDVTALNAYRYAPWFAFAWVPLTHLPGIEVWWSLAMLGASVAALWKVPHTPEGYFLLGVFAPILFAISAGGNVQPLMVAALVWGLNTRWGWLVVGLAGSLKVAPLAFCAVFIAQRRWWQAAAALSLAGALWAPILWFTVDSVTWSAGPASNPTWVWLLLASGSAVVTLYLAWRRSDLTPLAAGAAAVLALPRLFLYETAMLLPAVGPLERREPPH